MLPFTLYDVYSLKNLLAWYSSYLFRGEMMGREGMKAPNLALLSGVLIASEPSKGGYSPAPGRWALLASVDSNNRPQRKAVSVFPDSE